ncbi:MAG TPA: hypothetical protein VFC24_16110 [Casimicrobiaceae bacterium]|nr:hypothetical protein [Casimicrobiaceae bacterium]
MKRYTRDDLRMINTARKVRAGAAVCIFGLVGAVWLQAELFADQMYDSSAAATATAPSSDASSTPMPDAENPSALQH